MKKLEIWGTVNHRKIFLIDGLGAIISAFSLGIVLANFEMFFGVPQTILYFLALFPCMFTIFDFFCYNKNEGDSGLNLKIIALMNLLFCCLSIGLISYHHEEVTHWGFTYILLEALLVVALATFEYNISKSLSR